MIFFQIAFLKVQLCYFFSIFSRAGSVSEFSVFGSVRFGEFRFRFGSVSKPTITFGFRLVNFGFRLTVSISRKKLRQNPTFLKQSQKDNLQHFCRNFLGFECFFNNPNWNRNIFSDFLLDFTQKFQKWPFSVNRGFWIRFRFSSVFEKSVIFGFGSVRVLEFSVGFSVFRVTDQPLLKS